MIFPDCRFLVRPIWIGCTAVLTLFLTSAHAETLKTLDGTEYTDFKITGNDASGIDILHSAGGARIHFEQLPLEYRKRFNYDPQKIWFDNFSWAKKNAVLNQKPILMVFVARDSDPMSQFLQEEVFDTGRFKRFAPRTVIRMIVDFPVETPMEAKIREQNAQLKEDYDVDELPVVLLADPTGEIVGETDFKYSVDKRTKKVKTKLDEKAFIAEVERMVAEYKTALDEAKKAKEEAEKEATADNKETSPEASKEATADMSAG